MSSNWQQSIWDTLNSDQMREAARAGFDPYLDLSDGSEPFCEDITDGDDSWPEEDEKEWDFSYNHAPFDFYGCDVDNHHFKEKCRHSQRRKNEFRIQRLKKQLLKAVGFPIYSVSQRDLHKCMTVFGKERHCADNDNKIRMKRAAVEKRELVAARKEFLFLSSQC